MKELEEIYIRRSQLVECGAGEDWLENHMRGRGKLSLATVIQCAPPEFDLQLFVPNHLMDKMTLVVKYDDGGYTIYKDGIIHCEVGPAEVDGSGVAHYRLFGISMSFDEWKKAMIGLDAVRSE